MKLLKEILRAHNSYHMYHHQRVDFVFLAKIIAQENGWDSDRCLQKFLEREDPVECRIYSSIYEECSRNHVHPDTTKGILDSYTIGVIDWKHVRNCSS